MSTTASLPEEIERAITAGLGDFGVNSAEIILDSILKEGVLRDVPVIGSIVSLMKVGNGIREYVFLQKLIRFLIQSKDVSERERRRMIDEVNSDPRHETKVGMQIMMLLDRADDLEKASIVGRLFKAFLSERIDYPRFVLLSNIVNRAHLHTLIHLKENGHRGSESFQSQLFVLGLMNIDLKMESAIDAGLENRRTLIPVINYKPNKICSALRLCGLS
jgi:hypothetical protein